MSETIVLAKMTNGITALGKVTEEGGLKDAVAVQMKPGQQPGAMNVALVPFFFGLSDELVELKPEHLLCTTEAASDICDEYRKITSGIEIVGAGALNMMSPMGPRGN